MIITSSQKPSRSFYPREFCFSLVRAGFPVAASAAPADR
jgi:hypothetical protein